MLVTGLFGLITMVFIIIGFNYIYAGEQWGYGPDYTLG
jgi:hypothetical protein